MPHTLVCQYECCGRDAHGNPCFDVAFVERDMYYHYMSSHLLPQERQRDHLAECLTVLCRWYREAGYTQLRYQLIWEDSLPYPPSDGWSALKEQRA